MKHSTIQFRNSLLTVLVSLLLGNTGSAVYASMPQAISTRMSSENNKNHLDRNMMNTKYSPQWEHGEITNIFPNIFFVMGTNKINYEGVNIQTSRNMIIVKNGEEITLINTVRLDERHLKIIESMGKIKNIVKIGPFHGRDDAFYIDRYKAKLWALKGMKHNDGVKSDFELEPNGKMPFPNSSIFIFKTTTQPEGIIHIEAEGGILITCDSIKNWTYVDDYFSKQTGENFISQGMIQSANIDAVWINEMQPKVGDFKRLLTSFKFQHMLSAHGQPLFNSAYIQISNRLQALFDDN